MIQQMLVCFRFVAAVPGVPVRSAGAGCGDFRGAGAGCGEHAAAGGRVEGDNYS